MNYVIVGHCPRCGAPIYAPMIWMGTTPPPSTPSCNCISPDMFKAWTDTNIGDKK